MPNDKSLKYSDVLNFEEEQGWLKATILSENFIKCKDHVNRTFFLGEDKEFIQRMSRGNLRLLPLRKAMKKLSLAILSNQVLPITINKTKQDSNDVSDWSNLSELKTQPNFHKSKIAVSERFACSIIIKGEE